VVDLLLEELEWPFLAYAVVFILLAAIMFEVTRENAITIMTKRFFKVPVLLSRRAEPRWTQTK
jgi:hypothetical protein